MHPIVPAVEDAVDSSQTPARKRAERKEDVVSCARTLAVGQFCFSVTLRAYVAVPRELTDPLVQTCGVRLHDTPYVDFVVVRGVGRSLLQDVKDALRGVPRTCIGRRLHLSLPVAVQCGTSGSVAFPLRKFPRLCEGASARVEVRGDFVFVGCGGDVRIFCERLPPSASSGLPVASLALSIKVEPPRDTCFDKTQGTRLSHRDKTVIENILDVYSLVPATDDPDECLHGDRRAEEEGIKEEEREPSEPSDEEENSKDDVVCTLHVSPAVRDEEKNAEQQDGVPARRRRRRRGNLSTPVVGGQRVVRAGDSTAGTGREQLSPRRKRTESEGPDEREDDSRIGVSATRHGGARRVGKPNGRGGRRGGRRSRSTHDADDIGGGDSVRAGLALQDRYAKLVAAFGGGTLPWWGGSGRLSKDEEHTAAQ